jgi:antitoxin HicB
MKRSEPITAAEYSYTVLFQPEPEGGFTVTCPSLPGLVSYGATLDEARTMAADAIGGYLETLQEDGESIPASDTERGDEPAPIIEHVRVKLAIA